VGSAAAVLSLCATAFADTPPTLLGSFKDWTAFQATASGGRTCYALSQPKSSEPKKAKRDPVYFLVSDWPSRRVKAEPEVVPGYEYKADSSVTAAVGSDKFEFFTKNEDGGGSAWVKDASDESRLVEAMKRGSDMVVTGVSKRGTTTTDTYSLNGLTAALDKVHAACGM
jgi:hypothetical protein